MDRQQRFRYRGRRLLGSGVARRRRIAIALSTAFLVLGGLALIAARSATGPTSADGDEWVTRTGTLLTRTLVTTSPPRLVLPPSQADSYQMAQAVTALAGFGVLQDRDWAEFDGRVADNLERELGEGYSGPQSLAAQLVRAAEAAGRPFGDNRVIAALRGVAQTAPDRDVYDQVSAAVVQDWAAEGGSPVVGALSQRDVRRAAAKTGCLGDEALFLQAALTRVHAAETGCNQAQRDALVDSELQSLRSVEPAQELSGDRALLVRAVGFLARTPEQVSAVSALKSGYVTQLNDGQVSDPLTAAYALSETPGDGNLNPELADFLRSIVAMGGAPVGQKLSPSTAAAVARALELAKKKVPSGLLVDSAQLPTEARARVLLALQASEDVAERLLTDADLPTGSGSTVTAVFQLLLRHQAPLCSRWAGTARRVAQDTRSTLLDRSLAYRYLQECGQDDDPVSQVLRDAWEALKETDIRATFNKQSVACALRFGEISSPKHSWGQWAAAVERGGGVSDESGELDVAQTHMMTALLTEQRSVCRDGVYW